SLPLWNLITSAMAYPPGFSDSAPSLMLPREGSMAKLFPDADTTESSGIVSVCGGGRHVRSALSPDDDPVLRGRTFYTDQFDLWIMLTFADDLYNSIAGVSAPSSHCSSRGA